ncbi:MAG: prolyl oligopeptidase family serine peptidase [Bacillota bacterium]|jgi:dipeptidyl aminopeptidase/acylaminoacyl peptidase
MKRKVVARDITALRFVSDPALSVDGRIAYVITESNLEKNGYSSAIWVETPQGERRRFTYGQRSDGGLVRETSPRWSPDGRKLLFVSNRNGRPQLFALDDLGGEAVQLTKMPEGVGEPTWSPDGRYIAFTSTDPRDEAAEKDKNPDVRHITHLRYKFNGRGFTDTRRRHLYVLDTSDSSVRQVTKGDFDVSGINWTSDSQQLLFSACISPDCELRMIPDIHVIDLTGDNLRRLTAGEGTATNPVCSPDGQWIAFFGHVKGQIGYANTDLWVMPLAGGEAVNLTEAMDRSVGCSVGSDARFGGGNTKACWSADGQHLIVSITDGGTCHLYRVNVATRQIEQLTHGDLAITAFHHVAVDGEDRIAYIAGDVTNPGDVYLWQPGAIKQLTAVNADILAEWQLSVPERVEFQGTDGLPLEGWIMKPVGFEEGKKYPLIMEIHGGPHSTYGYGFFHEFQMLTSAGYGVLFMNPRGSRGYGEEFTKGVVGDWGGMDYADCMSAVDYAIQLDWVDAERLGVTGGSYGGYMTNWIVTQTDRFKAAVTLRSISNMYTKYGCSDIGWYGNKAGMGGRDLWDSEDFIMSRSPIRYAPQVKTPILIIHSELDFRCPMEQAEQWYVALKRLGKTVEFVRFAGENHELSRSGKPRNRIDRLNFILDWFNRYV